MIYYVLRNTGIFLKGAHEVSIQDIGELECLYYAVCGKVKEQLYDVNIRLDNNFIAPEEKYITFKSDGFGVESVSAGEFKAIMVSYEHFLYRADVVRLMREAFKAKHIRGHKSGSRPIFLDPRNMACGMIFGTLKEKERVALQNDEFEKHLENLPPELAAFHRRARYSTGIHMRARKPPKKHTSSPVGSGNSAEPTIDENETKGPQYLEYLDEYSVMSIESFMTIDSDDELEDQELVIGHIKDSGNLTSNNFIQQGNHPLMQPDNQDDHDKQAAQSVFSFSVHGEEEAGNQLSTQRNGLSSLTGCFQPSEQTGGNEMSCACGPDCLCAPLCATEPTEKCLCMESSLFCHVTNDANSDNLFYPRKHEEVAEAKQIHMALEMNIEITQQHPAGQVPMAAPLDTFLEPMDYMQPDIATNASAPSKQAHADSLDPQAHDGSIDIRDVIAKGFFGGSLSIFAIEQPNGERVRNCESEWHNQMRAAMDAHRQRYEPDPDWYFPPGTTYGRLSLHHISQQHTLRKRILDKTLGNITGKKAMCKPLRLKEELRRPTLSTNPMFDRSAHHQPGLMSGLFTGRFAHRDKAKESRNHGRPCGPAAVDNLKARRRAPY